MFERDVGGDLLLHGPVDHAFRFGDFGPETGGGIAALQGAEMFFHRREDRLAVLPQLFVFRFQVVLQQFVVGELQLQREQTRLFVCGDMFDLLFQKRQFRLDVFEFARRCLLALPDVGRRFECTVEPLK